MLLQKFKYESESYKETHYTQAEQSYLRGKKNGHSVTFLHPKNKTKSV